MGADNFALYDRGSGKRDRQIPGDVRKERTSEVATDVVDLSSRMPYGHEFSGGRRRTVVRSGVVVLPVVPSVRTIAYANGLVHPDFCLTRDCLTFFRGDLQVSIEDRARADSVKVLFVTSKTDQNREGRTTTRVRMAEGARVGKTRSELSKHWWSSSMHTRDFPGAPP